MTSELTSNVSEWIDLWDHNVPGNFLVTGLEEKPTENNNITDVGTPQIKVWFPNTNHSTGAAILIFSGRGYSFINQEEEAELCAKWFADKGILAAVVKYRVGMNLCGFPIYPFPILDARRAIRKVRSVATDWGIKENKIGVIGFSAGGHLASICATIWDHSFAEEGCDRVDDLSCRPDFSAMIYPIISMSESWALTEAQVQLLGQFPDPDTAMFISSDKHVNNQTPPCFLAHSNNDDVVSPRHSLAFATKCHEKGVTAACYIFEEGGHGYGLRGEGDSSYLTELLNRWLISLNLMK